MIVVADTSPINYLVLIDAVDLLRELYGTIALPEAVRQELVRPASPRAVREWAFAPGIWVKVMQLKFPIHPAAYGLDRGEAQAISLALELSARAILIDEVKGRRAAAKAGLFLSGTLGVLRDGQHQGLCNGRELYDRLGKTSFRCSDAVEREYLDSVRG